MLRESGLVASLLDTAVRESSGVGVFLSQAANGGDEVRGDDSTSLSGVSSMLSALGQGMRLVSDILARQYWNLVLARRDAALSSPSAPGSALAKASLRVVSPTENSFFGPHLHAAVKHQASLQRDLSLLPRSVSRPRSGRPAARFSWGRGVLPGVSSRPSSSKGRGKGKRRSVSRGVSRSGAFSKGAPSGRFHPQ